MRRRSVIALGLMALAPQAVFAQPKPPWTTLLDGTSLDGWTPLGDANWTVKDGAVQADHGGGFLVSRESYRDVEIRAELWVSEDANSGVFIRCADPAKITAVNGYEVNVFDRRSDPTYGTGAIVGVAKVSPMPKAGGHWNVMEITAKGDRFDVTFNGQRTVEGAHDGKVAAGHIALQYGQGLVKFRKLQVRPI